jgi:hypothetical protein
LCVSNIGYILYLTGVLLPLWWNLVDTKDLKSFDHFDRVGSSPASGTGGFIMVQLIWWLPGDGFLLYTSVGDWAYLVEEFGIFI